MTAGRVAVVGPGRMGVGIAVAFAVAGWNVDLVDLKERAEPMVSLDRAKRDFAEHIALLESFGVIPADRGAAVAGRLALVPSGPAARAALGTADIVVEAVPERFEAKRDAFAEISAAARADALVTSTTSSFLSDQLAELVVHPERFLNTHWLNPAYLMPLVEVSPAEVTSADALASTSGLLRDLGKVPVTVRPSPGYIVPRLQALVMNEAARMVEEGVVSADDLDVATRLGFGLRFAVLGLVEFIDWGGVDTLLHASNYLRDELGAERFASPDVVAERVAAGATGMSAGRGLREFSDAEISELQQRRTGELVALLRHLGRAGDQPRQDARSK